jgi:hypothetical protein
MFESPILLHGTLPGDEVLTAIVGSLVMPLIAPHPGPAKPPAMPIAAGQPPRRRHDEGPSVCPRGLHLGL